LLYVACTRARKTLHLMGHVVLSTDKDEIRPARAGSLLSLLWPAVREEFEDAFDTDNLAVNQESADAWLLPELRRLKKPFALPAFKPLVNIELSEDIPEQDREVEFYWVGSEARIAGTLVHRWLQLAADDRVEISPDKLDQTRATTQRWLREFGVNDDAAKLVTTRVESALEGIVADSKGRWLMQGEGAAELALTGIYDGEVSSVVLDRVRIDEHGKHWIVDYKTSTHEGGNLDAFLQAEIIRYTPQLQKYAHMYSKYSAAEVACALYFPLLQEFVEIPLQDTFEA
jgi:ATP-dependent helicase/nuclease subunit A